MRFDLPHAGHKLLVALALQVEPGPIDVVGEGVAEAASVLVDDAGGPGQGALLSDDLEHPNELEAKGVTASAAAHVFLLSVYGLSDVHHKLDLMKNILIRVFLFN